MFEVFIWRLEMFCSFHRVLLAHFSSFPLFAKTLHIYRLAEQLNSIFLQHLGAKTDDSEGKFCYQLE